MLRIYVSRYITVSNCFLHITNVCIDVFRLYTSNVQISVWLFYKTIIIGSDSVQRCVYICSWYYMHVETLLLVVVVYI